MPQAEFTIIGGGLAGSEAAWQAAEKGIKVRLYEMRPSVQTPAHKTEGLAELVCSNSLGSNDPLQASGILKEEMRRMGSLILRAADGTTVPAGTALAVEREEFSRKITKEIENHPNIRVIREEAVDIPSEGTTLIATGPLTSSRLAKSLRYLTRSDYLYFFDSIAPIVDADSIDMNKVFRASRYGKGGDDYINCPMTREEYDRFYSELMGAEKVPLKSFEKTPYFEGCIPLEVMAERGRETLLFGPMKPVGLKNPRTDKRPFAVVQLRKENIHGTCYNMVGFQTKLKWPEQRRVFRLIPGLENAEFLRYGSLHRNTFINSPFVLTDTLQSRRRPEVFFAGQLVGVEGYLESAAMGLLAGLNAARILSGLDAVTPPDTTALGSLMAYLTRTDPRNFQPMNINFGLFPPLERRIRDRNIKRKEMGRRAMEELDRWIHQKNLL
ncbi:MAG TPA: methylenetetrahydrofolate--tRNA-(uracil(54)-C(5))-methyltransferase (FADH(2)-oxidizing) TrmFO [Nitrospiria bacterium]|nr:methylenetetrahydrofolate--tRNA-(uracil(54)-C(5))-methyltransferase (FADH(2)-oxidizing) TrmFO [Nitrospiria bacterium]